MLTDLLYDGTSSVEQFFFSKLCGIYPHFVTVHVLLNINCVAPSSHISTVTLLSFVIIPVCAPLYSSIRSIIAVSPLTSAVQKAFE